MAEYCLDCWNRLNKCRLAEKDVVFSAEPELCEGCGEQKNVIAKFKKWDFLKRVPK